MSDPPKRGRGCPKGSKNRPGAKNVGWPYKNGQPAQARNTKDKGTRDPSHVALAGPSASLALTPNSTAAPCSPERSSEWLPSPSESPSCLQSPKLATNPPVPSADNLRSTSVVTVVPSPIHESLEEQPALPSSSLPLPSLAASLLDAQSDPTSHSLCAQPTTPEPCQPMPTNSDLECCTGVVSRSAMVQNPYGSDLKADNVHEGDEDEDEDMLEEFNLTCEDADLEDEAESTGDQPMTVNAEHEMSALSAPAQMARQHARPTLPAWLPSEYQRLRERLIHEIKNNSSHLPTCYDRQTFFDGPENPFLVAKSTFQLTPGLFHQPRFFIWLPHLLVDRIPCPACLDAGRQPAHGSCVYLQKHGFAQCTRRVVDIDCNIFIFLEMVSHRSSSGSLSSCWTTASPFGEFGDRDGYAGYIPHAPYFARFYDMLVEESAPASKQLIASLPADILKQDHSFKAIKRLGKTDGVPAFNALFTTINQYSEIRSMNFTPSKAQDGWAPILAAMLPSLASFGHSPPKIVFTDNIRADKDKLLSIFPSLSAGVIPVQPASTQEPLVLPEDWSSIPLTTMFQVNHRFDIIMNQHTPTTPVIVAFSVQWPIDAATGKTGRVALIQVAYQKVVYLIQTRLFMQDGYISLPHSLLMFFQSKAYRKVGVNVMSNLQRLQGDCIPACRSVLFAGSIDVGQMARERDAAPSGSSRIVTLCANVLRRRITRDSVVCISPAWGHSELPSQFVQHAVLESYATWSLYLTLTTVKAPQNVTGSTPGGTAVTMYAPDGRTIAQGLIAIDRPLTFNGIRVTKTRVVMVVREVLVPGYLISGSLLASHTPTALSAFGPAPFSILCQANHLQTSSVPPLLDPTAVGSCEDQTPVNPPAEGEILSTDTNGDSFQSIFLDAVATHLDASIELETEPEQTIPGSSIDEGALEAISQLILDITNFVPESVDLVRTRIKGDIWHLFHQFPISLHHGLRRPFAHALSTAIFLTDVNDKRAVTEILARQNVSYDAKLISKSEWILTRVRRYVPPPEILFS
ncbi:uncharacterized protein F5147DRAFT_808699 [Suillus discolor]|uniref:Uncharacterized protein n=1 Tax=Suillus discolor TaxID=1912936 RepID=A0A9P7F1X9_9AGAM|nr:uncharacterized protein F5147DRAFT_808699 [Suillus discolor]KAG2103734.1 hypothetical protein F5147DRAFT_808699 [Suillus discolor]